MCFRLSNGTSSSTASDHTWRYNLCFLGRALILLPEQCRKCQSSTLASITNNSGFAELRSAEFSSPVQREVFSIVSIAHPNDHRIFGVHYVDLVINEEAENSVEKSWLFNQSFNVKQHDMLTHAATVQQSSAPLLLDSFVVKIDLNFFSRDVSQAYWQSRITNQRPIFVRLSIVLDLSTETLFCVEQSLYELPKALIHWLQTHLRPHRDNLSQKSPTLDTCFLYTSKSFSNDFDTCKVSIGFNYFQIGNTTNTRIQTATV